MTLAGYTGQSKRFAVCISCGNTPAALVVGKVYQQLQDEVAARSRMLRIMDESGEDYLHPMRQFQHLP